MSDDPPPLEALRRRIERSRRSAEGMDRRSFGSKTGYGYAADLCAGFLVGTGLGYVLDRQFGTLPIFLVLGLILGTASGFLMVYEAVRRGGAAERKEAEKQEENMGTSKNSSSPEF